jgi:outer membrane protein assembly factor BamB
VEKSINIKWLVFSVTVPVLLFAGLVRGDFLYAITMDDELLSLNPVTGSGILIGMLDTAMDGIGLATRGEEIYTFDQNTNRLQQLDPLTAHTLATIDIGIVIVGEGSIAFRSDGTGFLARSFIPTEVLWSFDPVIPDSTMIGTLEFGMDGLAFDADDILYGLSQISYELYLINPTNAETTLIGPTGLTSQTLLGGLTFSSDGTLYAVLDDALYTLNPKTGAATLIGPIGYDNVSGITATTPAPGAVLLCGLGVILAGRLRRHKIL